ncbi:hypothetical protein I6J18_15770 [Peribacillus psychrosaccharolyticus]|uniref:YwpF-like protein n=1 Tax=Peribacillus psychrosaccharolyticus TaxID=1407 RepID=A0A974S0B8_PERPY|nr:YwpF family protein [Peribacillus psychrosaccharolyticus]MEC2055408.1 YwpF family protein [Peribacillus psychrosaccharolyticus]MED3743562.1 YwpF family protein [Peribacillus psychrosaccharolyticus]QQS99094.1 hypothetical protein I6J18_15770 [Peribacillus psychrosaccharolyticus]
MKSFKLISVQLISEDNQLVNVELTDGLIINKEDDNNTWIVESFLTEEGFNKIKDALPEINQEIMIQAVITKKDNDPAFMKTVLRKIKPINGHVSLLFEGHLQKSRSKYAELLLKDLIQQGIVGNELIEHFKEKLRSRPQVVPSFKK